MADGGVLLYRKNGSHVLDATVRNTLAPGYVVDATVTVTVADAVTAIALTGATWPVTLALVSGSDRVYRATLPHALAVTIGQRLVATLTVVSGMLKREIQRGMLVVPDEG